MQARGVVQVVDRSAVIGSGPRQSSVGVLPVLGVAVLAEIEGIELSNDRIQPGLSATPCHHCLGSCPAEMSASRYATGPV